MQLVSGEKSDIGGVYPAANGDLGKRSSFTMQVHVLYIATGSNQILPQNSGRKETNGCCGGSGGPWWLRRAALTSFECSWSSRARRRRVDRTFGGKMQRSLAGLGVLPSSAASVSPEGRSDRALNLLFGLNSLISF